MLEKREWGEGGGDRQNLFRDYYGFEKQCERGFVVRAERIPSIFRPLTPLLCIVGILRVA